MSSQELIRRLGRLPSRAVQLAEWQLSHLLLRRAPWARNRFNQRYQALCFADYKHLRHGNPEAAESLWMEHNLRHGATVVDVGANHGIVALECSLFVGPAGRVHAFEPSPAVRDRLLWHLDINHIQNVSVFGAAVGERCGRARLHIYDRATGWSALSSSRRPADSVIDVDTVSLDQHCRTHGILSLDLLKIDIEGHELFALRGASQLLTEKRIAAVLFEIGERTCRNAGVEPQELLNELQSVGYAVYSITADGSAGEPVTRVSPVLRGQNFLAFPV
ncbi:MAG: FkbM family methyltransferase [Bryobacteraceae bacterium]